MIVYITVTSDEELRQILRLQQENLPASVSEETRRTEGFVTVEHSFELLKAMNEACPHVLAKDQNTVVGYALSMHPKFGNEIEVLRPMFAEIQRLITDPSEAPGLTANNFVVMGQVCVHKTYRKQGIFRKLYETQLEVIAPWFNRLITEVDATNTRSMEAHYAIGFQTLSKYTSDGKHWELIVLDVL